MKDNIFIYLAYFVQVPMTVFEALEIIEKRFSHRKQRATLMQIKESLSEGKSVTESFIPILKTLGGDTTVASVLKSSEKSGDFHTCFAVIGAYMQQKQKLQRELLEGISYPLVVLCISTLLSYAVVSFIFPKIIPVFTAMKVSIPKATVYILHVVAFIETYWLLIIFMSLLLTLISRYVYKEYIGVQEYIHNMLLKIPLLKNLIFYNISVQISRSLEILLVSSGSLLEACNEVLPEVRFIPIKKDLLEVREAISQGVTIDEAFMKTVHFSNTPWIDLLLVGEKTGKLDASLKQITTLYVNELHGVHKRLSKWSEPLLLVLVAGVVLFVALSVIEPMYSIVQHVSPQ